jgi:hypothetical protein
MAILSWLTSKKHFMRRSAVDEFRDFTTSEAKRLRHSDQEFDEEKYNKAVALVMQKLERHTKG